MRSISLTHLKEIKNYTKSRSQPHFHLFFFFTNTHTFSAVAIMSEQAAFHTYMYTPCHISKNILLHKPQQQLEVFFIETLLKQILKKVCTWCIYAEKKDINFCCCCCYVVTAFLCHFASFTACFPSSSSSSPVLFFLLNLIFTFEVSVFSQYFEPLELKKKHHWRRQRWWLEYIWKTM